MLATNSNLRSMDTFQRSARDKERWSELVRTFVQLVHSIDGMLGCVCACRLSWSVWLCCQQSDLEKDAAIKLGFGTQPTVANDQRPLEMHGRGYWCDLSRRERVAAQRFGFDRDSWNILIDSQMDSCCSARVGKRTPSKQWSAFVVESGDTCYYNHVTRECTLADPYTTKQNPTLANASLAQLVTRFANDALKAQDDASVRVPFCVLEGQDMVKFYSTTPQAEPKLTTAYASHELCLHRLPNGVVTASVDGVQKLSRVQSASMDVVSRAGNGGDTNNFVYDVTARCFDSRQGQTFEDVIMQFGQCLSVELRLQSTHGDHLSIGFTQGEKLKSFMQKAPALKQLWVARECTSIACWRNKRGNTALNELCSRWSENWGVGVVQAVLSLAPDAAQFSNYLALWPLHNMIRSSSSRVASSPCAAKAMVFLCERYPSAIKLNCQSRGATKTVLEMVLECREAPAPELVTALAKAWPSCVEETRLEPSNWQPMLHRAVLNRSCGSQGVCAALLAVCPKAVALRDNYGANPLMRACSASHHYWSSRSAKNPSSALIELCLSADPMCGSAVDKCGRQALHYFCCNESVRDGAESARCLQLLIAAHPEAVRTPATIFDKECGGPTILPSAESLAKERALPPFLPVQMAILCGQPAGVIKVLLDIYPEAAARTMLNRSGYTYTAQVRLPRFSDQPALPLEVAMSCHQQYDVLQALCDAFAKAIFLPGAEGRFPLHHAMLHNCGASIVNLLLQTSGKDPRAEHASMSQFYNGRADQPQLQPEEVSLCGAYATTPHQQQQVATTTTGRIAATKKDIDGQLPLHQGLKRKCSWSSVELVLAAYPEAVHVRDNEGLLPVHTALISSYPLPGLKVLLAASESPLPADGRFSASMLAWACQYSNKEAEVDELVGLAIAAGDVATAAAAPDATGALPLHWACQRKLSATPTGAEQQRRSQQQQAEADELATLRLIQRIAMLYPAALEIADNAGRLPLHWAATSPHHKVAEHILSRYPAGATTVTKDGQLPIFYAIEHSKKLPIVELFVELNDGVALKHFDAKGCCPLFLAMLARSSPEMIALLQNHAASPTISRETVPKALRLQLVSQQLMRSEDSKRFDEEEYPLEVDRANLFETVLDVVGEVDEEEAPLTYTPKVVYEGEEGMDYGGLSRDFFREWTDVMTNSVLFKRTGKLNCQA